LKLPEKVPQIVRQEHYGSLFKQHILKDQEGMVWLLIHQKRSAFYTALMPLSTLILIFNLDLEEMLFPRP
jgi:3-methyladenine DNA glycosylase Tag